MVRGRSNSGRATSLRLASIPKSSSAAYAYGRDVRANSWLRRILVAATSSIAFVIVPIFVTLLMRRLRFLRGCHCSFYFCEEVLNEGFPLIFPRLASPNWPLSRIGFKISSSCNFLRCSTMLRSMLLTSDTATFSKWPFKTA